MIKSKNNNSTSKNKTKLLKENKKNRKSENSIKDINTINKKKKSILFKKNILILITVKIILISLFLYGYFYVNSNYSNTIPLLAVTESNGKIIGGSIINLTLKITPGSGNINVNLNTIEEVDTQISIINSQKIACDLFNLDCSNYDFFYNFKGSALVLKGPSASSAIAILTAKTLKKEKLNPNSVITGALNSGGLIGNVGGIEEKIKIAEDNGFKKVIIPAFTNLKNISSKEHSIKIIKSLDLIDAYNKFNDDDFQMKTSKINDSKYKILMKTLGVDMCNRSYYLLSKINQSIIKNDSNLKTYLEHALNSLNSSKDAEMNENYYSMGSFCYNANINLRIIIEAKENMSLNELNIQVNKFNNIINNKLDLINSNNFRNNIKTMNDFYTYLILNNRIDEAREYLNEIVKYENDEKNKKNNLNTINSTINNSNTNDSNNIRSSNNSTNINNSIIINITNIQNNINYSNHNISSNISSNNSDDNYSNYNISNNESNNNNNKSNNSNKINSKVNINLIYLYSAAVERFYTIDLWAKFIQHDGSKIKFNNDDISKVCNNVIKQISIKSELLKKYNIYFFDKDIEKENKFQNPLSNQYLCIYNGLELIGKINTILNGAGINSERTLNYSKQIYNFTIKRLSLNSNGNFPLIPYIYAEYAGDLIKNNNSYSGMLYSNYALSYLDLNLYLKNTEVKNKTIFNIVLKELYENFSFLIGVLILIAFTNY